MSRTDVQNVVLFLVRIVPQGQGEAQHGRGARSGHHLSGDNDNDSQRHLKDENKLIYSVRGIHCKSFLMKAFSDYLLLIRMPGRGIL